MVSESLRTGEDDCLLVKFEGVWASIFAFEVTLTEPGLDRPAESGLSGGKLVRRLGGASRGKSGRTKGAVVRGRELGELGRDEGAVGLVCLLGELGRDDDDEVGKRPFDVEAGERLGVDSGGFLRVGVDGLETDREDKGFVIAGI